MTLYQSSGGSFELTAREWSNLLAHATRNGWQPGNPQPPAIVFDIERRNPPRPGLTGGAPGYERPIGQIMPARDVYALALALRAGGLSDGMDGSRLGAFCGFCEMGESVLLSEAAPVPALRPLVSAPPIEGQLINLFHSVSGPAVSPERSPAAVEELEPAHRP